MEIYTYLSFFNKKTVMVYELKLCASFEAWRVCEFSCDDCAAGPGREDRQEPGVAAGGTERQAGAVQSRAARPQRVQISRSERKRRPGAAAGRGGRKRVAAEQAEADAQQTAG